MFLFPSRPSCTISMCSCTAIKNILQESGGGVGSSFIMPTAISPGTPGSGGCSRPPRWPAFSWPWRWAGCCASPGTWEVLRGSRVRPQVQLRPGTRSPRPRPRRSGVFLCTTWTPDMRSQRWKQTIRSRELFADLVDRTFKSNEQAIETAFQERLVALHGTRILRSQSMYKDLEELRKNWRRQI